jgi:kojibiose phosphorylase
MRNEDIDKNWSAVEERFDVAAQRHWESIFALGTGYVTTRASIEEGFEDDDQSIEYDRIPANVSLEVIPSRKSRWGTFLPVIQGRHPFWRLGIVNLPYYLGLVVTADGEKLDLEKSLITGYRRWLNLKTATLYRELHWSTASGKKIYLLFRRYMNPEEKFVCVQECTIEMEAGSAELKIESYIDNDVRTNGFDEFAKHAVGSCDDGIVYSDITTNIGNRVVTASRLMADKAREFSVKKRERRVSTQCILRLGEHEQTLVRKLSVVVADRYFENHTLLDEARALLEKNALKISETLYGDHVECWARFWDSADIEIEASDPQGYNSQLAMRLAIYHLLRVKTKDEARGLICPKGTTTEVYMGAVFWDMEIFIEPFYIYTFPEMARNVHMFRYLNLPAARELTRKAGYLGVRYPWMSAAEGTETCPMWEYADHQVHITSDVVIGLWHYYMNTLDDDFLFDYGAEIILETARYWAERVEKVPGRDGYQIYGVMGPDEYKPLSNNNAYTNHSVKLNLRLAVKVAELMKARSPEKFARLKAALAFDEEELKKFREVESGLSIARDEARHIIWQCDNFDTAFVEPKINEIWRDKTELFGAFYSQEKRYRSKTLKQADVVALLAMFSEDFPNIEKAASFDYYWPFTIHDSSNSMCHHQIVLANLGRSAQAYQAWLRSIDVDFGALPRSSNGVHCANIGGMWQEVVFGFCGMVSALNTDVLSFRPCLPEEIHRISLKVQWRHRWLQVTVMQDRLTLKNLSSEPVKFGVFQKQYEVAANACVDVTLAEVEIV